MADFLPVDILMLTDGEELRLQWNILKLSVEPFPDLCSEHEVKSKRGALTFRSAQSNLLASFGRKTLLKDPEIW